MPGAERFKELLGSLGRHKTGKSCLYIKKLADIDQNVLSKIVEASVKEMARMKKEGVAS